MIYIGLDIILVFTLPPLIGGLLGWYLRQRKEEKLRELLSTGGGGG